MFINLQNKVYKLLHWEFWDWSFFYLPVYGYYLYLSVKARSLTFFSALNPGIAMGGLLAYSKKHILAQIEPEYRIRDIFFNRNKDRKDIPNFLKAMPLNYPLIAKPNCGERGKNVVKIDSEADLQEHLKQTKHDLLLQEYIDYPIELGVLYYYDSRKNEPKITSIVRKGFLSVVGDGRSTVLELMLKDRRKRLYIRHLQNQNIDLDCILPSKEEKILECIGNHRRGTMFLNANHLINDQLVEVFRKISAPIEHFYYGRLDCKVLTLKDLYVGKNIKIMEVNGANSEPAHIYQPNTSIWSAYRDLFKHWNIICEISRYNHRQGFKYITLERALRQIIVHLKSHKDDL